MQSPSLEPGRPKDSPDDAISAAAGSGVVGWRRALTSHASGTAKHITKDEPVSLLMIKQGIKDEFKLVAAIITDQGDEPFEHLKRLFTPVAAPFEHYEIEVHPTLAGISPEFKTASSPTKRLSTAFKDIVRANLEGRN
jgi:hypothetical protein